VCGGCVSDPLERILNALEGSGKRLVGHFTNWHSLMGILVRIGHETPPVW